MSNRRIAWFLRVNRVVEFCSNVAQSTYQAFWLGLLDSAALARLTTDFYGDSGAMSSREHNLAGFFPWENVALTRYFSQCGTVVVGACGGGREIIALHQRGIQADGFDCCASLVKGCRELLQEQGIASRIVLSQPDRVPEELGRYDGVVFGWGAWSHVAGRTTRLRFLREFHRRVPTGAPLLLSCVVSDINTRRARFIHAVAHWTRALSGLREPIERGDYLLSGAFWHHFARENIEAELIEGGFDPCYYYFDGYIAHVVATAR